MSLIHIAPKRLRNLKGQLLNHFHRYWISVPFPLWTLIWENMHLFLIFGEVRQIKPTGQSLPTRPDPQREFNKFFFLLTSQLQAFSSHLANQWGSSFNLICIVICKIHVDTWRLLWVLCGHTSLSLTLSLFLIMCWGRNPWNQTPSPPPPPDPSQQCPHPGRVLRACLLRTLYGVNGV